MTNASSRDACPIPGETEWTLVPRLEWRFDDEGGAADAEEEIEIQAGLEFPIGLSEEVEDRGIIATVEFEFWLRPQASVTRLSGARDFFSNLGDMEAASSSYMTKSQDGPF